jgi:hypothetical protein
VFFAWQDPADFAFLVPKLTQAALPIKMIFRDWDKHIWLRFLGLNNV